MRIATLLVALLTLVPAAPGAGAMDERAAEILAKVSATYRDMRRYYIREAMQAPAPAGSMRDSIRMTLLMAGDKPNRLRVQMDGQAAPAGSFGMLSVSNSDSTWMHINFGAMLNQYTAKAEAALEGGGPGAGARGDPTALLSRYAQLPQHAKNVRFVREEGDRLVVELDETAMQPVSATDSVHTTLWIDKKRYLVVQEAMQGTDMSMKAKLLEARIDEPLPDSLFSFAPPAGATKVAEFGLPGLSPSADLAGKEAPDFTLKTLRGESVSLKRVRGHVVLIDFWATWCGPCKRELPQIQKLARELGDRGLLVYGVTMDPAEKVNDYFQRSRLEFPTLLDADGAVHKLYHVMAIPVVLVIDRDGLVSRQFTGLTPEDSIRAALRKAGLP